MEHGYRRRRLATTLAERSDRFQRMVETSRIELSLRGPVGMLALHGGIEAGTASLARRVADATNNSLLVVRQQSNDIDLHFGSVHYESSAFPPIQKLLSHCSFIVSLHGHNRSSLVPEVLIGGRSRDLAARAAAILRRHLQNLRVVDDIGAIPPELRGFNSKNPVNGARSGGVQIEMPNLTCKSDPWSLELASPVDAPLYCGLRELASSLAHSAGQVDFFGEESEGNGDSNYGHT